MEDQDQELDQDQDGGSGSGWRTGAHYGLQLCSCENASGPESMTGLPLVG